MYISEFCIFYLYPTENEVLINSLRLEYIFIYAKIIMHFKTVFIVLKKVIIFLGRTDDRLVVSTVPPYQPCCVLDSRPWL